MAKQPEIYYAVTLECGDSWDVNRPMREQAQWDEHAAFMDALTDEGFVLLGGPLDSEEKILMILNAAQPDEITARLAADPWLELGVRRIAKIERWHILLHAPSF